MASSSETQTNNDGAANEVRQLLLVTQPQVSAAAVLKRLAPSAAAEALSGAGAGAGLPEAPVVIDADRQFRISDLSSLPLPQFNCAMLSSDPAKVLIVVDAVFGLTKRDLWAKTLASLADCPHLVFAIDNLRLVEAGEPRFLELRDEIVEHSGDFVCRRIDIVPVDFETGANVLSSADRPGWYHGPALGDLIEKKTAEIGGDGAAEAEASDQFSVYLCWLGKKPMLPGRNYLFDNGRQRCDAQISLLKHRYNPETMEHQAATSLMSGNVGYANLALDDEVDYRPFKTDHRGGRFCLLDPDDATLLAYGIINFGLRRATNIHWQSFAIDKQTRAGAKGQKPCLVWFTGLSGSGKSTIVGLIEKKLHALGRHTYVLDGDNVRHGLCRDLGFTDADRVENLRRVSETAKLFVDAGLIVLASFISPFRSERRAARELVEDGEFVEVFVHTPIEVCESRDPKGLYKKARAGQLKNFTGIDSPYEPPLTAEIVLHGDSTTADALADQVIEYLQQKGLLDAAAGEPT